MKFLRIFKRFSRLKIMQNFTTFSKISKQLARNTTYIFSQILTHNNITKISRKLSRTNRKFLGIFKGFLDSKIYKKNHKN
jgi:hypothetical protein